MRTDGSVLSLTSHLPTDCTVGAHRALIVAELVMNGAVGAEIFKQVSGIRVELPTSSRLTI